MCGHRSELQRLFSKVKSFPTHMGPWGGADLRFL